MSASRRSSLLLTTGVLLTLLAGTLGACGPDEGAQNSAEPPTGQSAGQPSGTDEETPLSATVSATQGAAFVDSSAEGTTAVIVPPGAFEPGTVVSFTPLENTDGVVQPGFRLEAAGDAQPKSPLFVAFAVPSDAVSEPAVYAYDGSSPEGRAVPSMVTMDGDLTSVVAIASHTTDFRLEERGSRPGPTDDELELTWIDFDSTARCISPAALGSGWDSEFGLSGKLAGSATGYVGAVTFSFFGDYDYAGTTGMAYAEWKGPMWFDALRMHWNPGWSTDLPAPSREETEGAGIIEYPVSPFVIEASGSFVAAESQPFLAWLEVEGLEGRRIPVEVKERIWPGGQVPCWLLITGNGPLVIVGDETTNPDGPPIGPFYGQLPVW